MDKVKNNKIQIICIFIRGKNSITESVLPKIDI